MSTKNNFKNKVFTMKQDKMQILFFYSILFIYTMDLILLFSREASEIHFIIFIKI